MVCGFSSNNKAGAWLVEKERGSRGAALLVVVDEIWLDGQELWWWRDVFVREHRLRNRNLEPGLAVTGETHDLGDLDLVLDVVGTDPVLDLVLVERTEHDVSEADGPTSGLGRSAVLQNCGHRRSPHNAAVLAAGTTTRLLYCYLTRFQPDLLIK